jgi:hypothetical protein
MPSTHAPNPSTATGSSSSGAPSSPSVGQVSSAQTPTPTTGGTSLSFSISPSNLFGVFSHVHHLPPRLPVGAFSNSPPKEVTHKCTCVHLHSNGADVLRRRLAPVPHCCLLLLPPVRSLRRRITLDSTHHHVPSTDAHTFPAHSFLSLPYYCFSPCPPCLLARC